MKVLITDRLSANHYAMVGFARAFNALGHEVVLWDTEKIPAFDIFNKFEPDVLMNSSWQLSRAQIKCIAKRPELKVLISLSNWGDDDSSLDPNETHIASAEEKTLVEELMKQSSSLKLGCCQYFQKYVSHTHNGWQNVGLDTIGLPMAANIYDFPLTEFSVEFSSDLTIVSGWWPAKGRNLDKFIKGLCYPNTNLVVRIFGNGWGLPQSYGPIPTELIKHYYASAVLLPSIFEPQAIRSGIDIPQRCFETTCCGGLQIAQRLDSLEKDVYSDDEILFMDSPKELVQAISHYREHPEERLSFIKKGLKKVYSQHTFVDRVQDVFKVFGFEKEVQKAQKIKEENYNNMITRYRVMYENSL